jgi:hypothetical protein
VAPMTAVDVLGFWFPISGLFVIGLGWVLLRDTLRTPPGGDGGGDDGGSDRASPSRPPWSWSRRGGRPGGRSPAGRRARARR